MEKHVSIARALKEKSRLIGRINILTDVINHQNSLAEGSTRSIDLQDAYRQVKELSESLIKIKAAIARGNRRAWRNQVAHRLSEPSPHIRDILRRLLTTHQKRSLHQKV